MVNTSSESDNEICSDGAIVEDSCKIVAQLFPTSSPSESSASPDLEAILTQNAVVCDIVPESPVKKKLVIRDKTITKNYRS